MSIASNGSATSAETRMVAWARRAVVRNLRDLPAARVNVTEGGDTRRLGAASESCELEASIRVYDPRFWIDVALGGSVGAGESYMRGRWSCDDLGSLVRILVRHRDRLERVESGAATWLAPLRRIAHRMRDNSPRGSRRNVAAHYDLGNDFFSLFLDPTMTYSCGVFPDPSATMERASEAKNDLICRKLALAPRHRLLEIGTGWGSFAEHAARHYGCRVVTTTLSRNQFEFASERIRGAGLRDRVELLLEDYRELASVRTGRFDRIVSVEMIEAVGHRHLDTYWRTCSDLLASDGSMLLQAIVIADHLFDEYRRSVDFIQRYVFPGGALPSVSAIASSLGRVTDLRISHLQDITAHYPETLRRWRRAFRGNLSEIRRLGYPEDLIRMWDFYLGYCEGGFEERSIGDVQLLLSKPAARPPLPVPQS